MFHKLLIIFAVLSSIKFNESTKDLKLRKLRDVNFSLNWPSKNNIHAFNISGERQNSAVATKSFVFETKKILSYRVRFY